MKEVKKFILVDFIILLLKLVAGFLCKSYAILTSSLIDLLLILSSLMVLKKKDNSRLKGFLTSIIGFIFIIGSIGMVYVSFIKDVKIVSLLSLLFIVMFIVIRHFTCCIYTNLSFQKREGLLTFNNKISNMDFIIYAIFILDLVCSKCSRWVDLLKYSDRCATILIALLVSYYGFKLIINSFKVMENKEFVIDDEFKKEISDRVEVKKINSFDYYNFGGVRSIDIELNINEGTSLIDLNTFTITLADYLLKKCDSCFIRMNNKKKEKVVKRVKVNARNSGSRNSKKNVKGKNSKKTNKKR